MLRWCLRKLGYQESELIAAPRTSLPSIDRADIAHLMRTEHGLPLVDWEMAQTWVEQTISNEDERSNRMRAIFAAWMDELRNALPETHRRWRRDHVEGLAPAVNNMLKDVADATDHSLSVIQHALRVLRSDRPIPPLAVVVTATNRSYYSLFAAHDQSEGASATSGGCFVRGENGRMPMLLLPAPAASSQLVSIIAHELTHHALAEFNLPPWVEEGFTQMMEERAAGSNGQFLDPDLMRRHRTYWAGGRIASFWSGEAFLSPYDQDQQMAYHLAQLLARRELERRPKQFLAFVIASGQIGEEAAAVEHLGAPLNEWAAEAAGLTLE